MLELHPAFAGLEMPVRGPIGYWLSAIGYSRSALLAICCFLSYLSSNLPRVRKMNGIAGITRTRQLFA